MLFWVALARRPIQWMTPSGWFLARRVYPADANWHQSGAFDHFKKVPLKNNDSDKGGTR